MMQESSASPTHAHTASKSRGTRRGARIGQAVLSTAMLAACASAMLAACGSTRAPVESPRGDGNPVGPKPTATAPAAPEPASQNPCQRCRGRASAELLSELRARGESATHCFSDLVRGRGPEQVSLELSLRVGADGSLCRSEAVRESPRVHGLAECVARTIESSPLPAPGDACKVVLLPVTFNRAIDAGAN